MTEAESHELRPWLRRAACALRDAGIDSARVDAESIAAFVLGVPRGSLVAVDTAPAAAMDRMNSLVSERAQRIPLQYLTGVAAFGPLDVAVGPGVFVPRPETEVLLEWAIARCAEMRTPPRVVDLCSGSGALAVAVAATTSAHVIAVENHPEALTWLRQNVIGAPDCVGGRVEVMRADVRDPDAFTGVHADLVVANPPYVPAGTRVAPEVGYDPPVAVFAGADGMAVIAPMLRVVATILEPGGWFGVEHDDTTQDTVLDAVRSMPPFETVRGRTDLNGRPRFVTARNAPGSSPTVGSVTTDGLEAPGLVEG